MSNRIPGDLDAFWSSDHARKLRHADTVRRIMNALIGRPELLFDITFYARFAQRTFAIMRREGKDAAGFERMQQSFREAVDKVRVILNDASTLGFENASAFTAVDVGSFSKLIELIGDLSILKDWMISAEEADVEM